MNGCDTAEKPTVLFVAVPSALGGSNRALVTLLAALGARVHRVVAGPGHGALRETVVGRGLADEYVSLVRRPRLGRLERMLGGARLAVWVLRRRRKLTAIHANATTGFNVAAPAAILSGVPLVAWVHDSLSSPWGRRLGPLLRRAMRRVHWMAVSTTAANVLVENGLCRLSDVQIVPNPIDPDEVVAVSRVAPPDDRLRIGFLGAATDAKGFDLLPDVISLTSDLPLTWKLFVTHRFSPFEQEIWSQMSAIDGVVVENPGRTRDVRSAYAQCDLIFNPSRWESFSRVTAEALLNGLPVVASDIEPMRALLGDGTGGLLFAPGQAEAAAAAIRRIVEDPTWRRRSSRRIQGGRDAIAEVEPQKVAAQMLAAYGNRPSPPPASSPTASGKTGADE